MAEGLKKLYRQKLKESFNFSTDSIKILDEIELGREEYSALYKSQTTFFNRIYEKNKMDNFHTEFEEDRVVGKKSRYNRYLNGFSPLFEITSVKNNMEEKISSYITHSKSYHKNLLTSIYSSFSVGDYLAIKIIEYSAKDKDKALNTWIKIKGQTMGIKEDLLEKIINFNGDEMNEK
jgi:hypothetical protein